jgi:2'-5' RNA ligase
VRQYSSDKEPHLTLLYLGAPNYDDTELKHIAEYVEHAASQLTSFGMEVDRRGVLGDDKADVLFFVKRWAKQIVDFRGHLLQNELINLAFLSADQFPDWVPHLTMGFPDKPAKKDNREFQRYSYVRFDRIALWTDDSVGPTFTLKSDMYSPEIAMSEADQGVDEILAHYGIKGMHWGSRKGGVRPGSAHPQSSDSARATTAHQVVKRSGVKALSNADLKILVDRINLEQQLGKLAPSRVTKARRSVGKTLSAVGNQQLNMVLNQAVNAQISKALGTKKK